MQNDPSANFDTMIPRIAPGVGAPAKRGHNRRAVAQRSLILNVDSEGALHVIFDAAVSISRKSLCPCSPARHCAPDEKACQAHCSVRPAAILIIFGVRKGFRNTEERTAP